MSINIILQIGDLCPGKKLLWAWGFLILGTIIYPYLLLGVNAIPTIEKKLDLKYNTPGPNIPWVKPGLGSPFWKGITCTFSTVRRFYYWKVGNGRSVAF